MTIALILIEWLLRIGMVVLILLRKRGPAALAWIMVSLALPIVGIVLYVLIGESQLAARRGRQHARALQAVNAFARLSAQRVGGDGVPRQRRNLAHLAERLGDMPTLPGNAAQIIADPHAYLASLAADIDTARSFVHLTYYIFWPDAAGKLIQEALIRAAKRGVTCRLLVDAVGSHKFWKLMPELTAAGVHAVVMLPVNPLRRRLARMDLRNHRKLAIIDGEIAYTGSQNITDPVPPGPDRRPQAWRRRRKRRGWDEISVRLTGPIVIEGEVVFIEDWYASTGEALSELNPGQVRPPRPQGETTSQMVPSGPTVPVDAFYWFVVAAFHDAAESIEVCNPYFVPDDTVVMALCIAAMRGVDVRLVLPADSDHPLVNAAARSRFAELLAAGVKIYQHMGELLHSKTIAIDKDLAIIGSGNIDMRSFHLNFELNLVLYGQQVTNDLRVQHARYMAQSRPLVLEEWKNRSWRLRLNDNLLGLMGPLL